MLPMERRNNSTKLLSSLEGKVKGNKPITALTIKFLRQEVNIDLDLKNL